MSPSQVSQVSQVLYTVALTAAVVETSTVLSFSVVTGLILHLCIFVFLRCLRTSSCRL